MKTKVKNKQIKEKPISKKQQEIYQYIERLRYLNRIQIQSLLKHKDYKTINIWLKDLVKRKLLLRDVKTDGINTKPAVYYLSKGRDKDSSKDFKEKCILLADIFLELRKITDNKKDQRTFTLYFKQDYLKDEKYYFLKTINPDVYFQRHKTGEKTNHLLVEVIQDRLPKRTLGKKIRDYLRFFFSNEWENHIKRKFPTLLFILPSLSTLIDTKRIIREVLKENDNPKIDINLSTREEIKISGLTSDIWEEI